ncbi:hypothetical protein TPHA_0J01540 [Tetrapisispora phaffii CBS 4417]|uniref:Golgi apparatus membrane protein TVP38 n=1 Tax=Tetrapisispora phaffii (strain ATCC 24235 / CBS 4417 / NBRC 1672 / NRRL Y-8282 / UCD 70-5) TaxID=1071381 RepID=G8BYN3_TETPH|nr:hypothetical protein TPHA_0J01540 [Tetrapisispora phaffii CBS 4417]CCE64975.1 hypothetical protein TPHA_0J01540 [Tetrapisispora phaffii CBS 4417]
MSHSNENSNGHNQTTRSNGNADEFDDYFRDLDNEMDAGNDGFDDDFLDIYNLAPRDRLVYQAKKTVNQILGHFYALPIFHRIIIIILLSVVGLLGFILLIFHEKILNKLVSTSNELKESWSTTYILFFLIFLVSFPPLIGFSLISTVTGIIYGISFHGWSILASGAVVGSVCSFAVFKTFFHDRAERLVHMNSRFEAFASILQENNSYFILALLRLCPFPYSLTNGAVAAVYGVSVKNFAIANIITTPKLVIYLFVGSKIKNFSEAESAGTKLLDVFSIVLALAALVATAWILYFKTQKRFAQLQSQRQSGNHISIDPTFEI